MSTTPDKDLQALSQVAMNGGSRWTSTEPRTRESFSQCFYSPPVCPTANPFIPFRLSYPSAALPVSKHQPPRPPKGSCGCATINRSVVVINSFGAHSSASPALVPTTCHFLSFLSVCVRVMWPNIVTRGGDCVLSNPAEAGAQSPIPFINWESHSNWLFIVTIMLNCLFYPLAHPRAPYAHTLPVTG